MKRLVCATLLAVAAVGCSTEKREEGPPRPVRFAVIAAPEVGGDDGDLALAVTKLSREAELDFVLVPGPVLAKDADSVSLELLKNDLGQIAPAVYVGFASVTSSSGGASKLKADEILSALEKAGPGEEHAVAYTRTPPRQPLVIVNVVGPDGKSKLGKRPPNRLVVQLGTAPEDVDVIVRVGDAPRAEWLPVAAVATDGAPARHVAIVTSPPLRSKLFLLATVWPGRLEVQPVALEGPSPPALEAVVIPRKRD